MTSNHRTCNIHENYNKVVCEIVLYSTNVPGMLSLKKMLPLYDTGSGSVYDLRHFTLGMFI